MTRCPDAATLAAFAEAALGDHQAAAVGAHVDACPLCAAHVRALDPLGGALARLDTPPPPDDLVAAVLAGRPRDDRSVVGRALAVVLGTALWGAIAAMLLREPAASTLVASVPVVLADLASHPAALQGVAGGAAVLSLLALATSAVRVRPA